MSRNKKAPRAASRRQAREPSAAPSSPSPSPSSHRADSRALRFLRSPGALTLFWLLALTYFWGVRYADFLFAAYDNSLFITRWDFLKDWLSEPVGALGYATAFIMQLGRYPILLGLALATLGVTLALETATLLNLRGYARHLAFLPSLALAIGGTWNAYYVYSCANVTLVFSGYVGANLALLTTFALRALERGRLAKYQLSGLLYLVAYFALGAWSSLAMALFVIETALGRQVTRGRAARALWLAFLALALPYLAYELCYYDQTPDSAIWTQGLFDPTLDASDPLARAFVVGGPLVVVALLLLCALATGVVARVRSSASVPRVKLALSGAVTVTLTLALWSFAYRVEPFFAILAQNRALTQGDWDAILRIDATVERPIDYSVALRNVALFERGELAERAFERPIGGLATVPLDSETFEKIKRQDPEALKELERFRKWRVTQRGSLNSTSEIILCRYGLPNVATRSAMNKRAVCRGRSAATLKVLAYCALVGGERELATRYARELNDAVNQRFFAKLCYAYMASDQFDLGLRNAVDDKTYDAARYPSGSEAATAQRVELHDAAARFGVDPTELARFADSIARSRRMRPQRNFKRIELHPDLARLYDLFTDPFALAPPEMRDAELVAALFQKGDLTTPGDRFFLNNIETYIAENAPKGRLPKALEQGYATLRFETAGNDWAQTSYQFSEETTRAFAEYVEFYNVINGATQLREAQDGIREHCAGTYWGYLKDDSSFIRF